MIDKNDAQKQGFNTLNRSEARLRQRDELFQKLKAILPGLIDSDNILNIRALEDAVDLSDTTSNNQGYELTFAGKGLAKAKAEVPTDKELKVEQGQSKNFDSAGNVVIRGDNLDVLKILKQNYAGKIKCIYIDPPYNTESDGFIYSDNFRQSEAQLIEDFGLQEETVNFLNDLYKTKTHSGWLAFMYPRLKLARQLLTEDGVIFISIDDKEQANLKILCDEIFGEDNFVANFIWNKQHSQQQGIIKKYHEFIFCYARDISKPHWITGGEGEIDAGALKKISEKNPESEFVFPAGVRFDAPDDTEFTGTYGDSEKVTVAKGILKAKGGKTVEPVTLSAGWTQKTQMTKFFNKEEVIDTRGQRVLEFYFTSTGKLKCKKERVHITPSTILPQYGMSSNHTEYLASLFYGINIFDNPKPVPLIKDFVKWFVTPNDLILDFFAGSGTTGEAVMRLNAEDGGNRKFILVQWDEEIPKDKAAYDFCKKHRLEPVISSITLERLRRAGAKIEEERRNKANLFADTPLDTGFRVFSLAPRREIAEENGQYTIAHAGGLSPMDRLYNLLAASCQPLDTPMEEIEKDILYRGGEAVYILGKPKESLEKYKNLPIYIDGYADISLEQFLNLTADEKENVRIVY